MHLSHGKDMLAPPDDHHICERAALCESNGDDNPISLVQHPVLDTYFFTATSLLSNTRIYILFGFWPSQKATSSQRCNFASASVSRWILLRPLSDTLRNSDAFTCSTSTRQTSSFFGLRKFPGELTSGKGGLESVGQQWTSQFLSYNER